MAQQHPSGTAPGRRASTRRARWALQSLNFFMADMQAGIGPFLGVFLQQRGWTTGPIGTVMTAGGVAGMVMTAPAGAFIDHTTHKRWVVVVTGICTVAASFLILLSQAGWVVTASQIATAIAGAAIGPAVAGMTLGIVRQKGFNAQNGRNQAWNHAGNMVGAGLSGWLGWKFGMPAIFYLAAVFGVLAIASVLLIPERAIDHQAARGLEQDESDDGKGRGRGLSPAAAQQADADPRRLARLFHLGNGAMLPLYGLAVVGAGKGNPAMFTATTVVVAQGGDDRHLAARDADGRRAGLLARPADLVRGAADPRAARRGRSSSIGECGRSRRSTASAPGCRASPFPAWSRCLLDGTGRVNVGQGAVMTVQGLGASLSPALGGWLAQILGYRLAFFILGSFALGSLALWLGFAGTLRAACDGPGQDSRRLARA